MTSPTEFNKTLYQSLYVQLFSPQLAQHIGLEKATFIMQIHYWLNKCGKLINDKLWVYNTYDDWKKQFPYWSNFKIYNIIKSLKAMNLIFVDKKNNSRGNRTNWYTINYPLLRDKLKNVQLFVPELAHIIGFEEALVIQQIHYWLNKCGKSINDKYWIYNTYDDWKKQFPYWSASKIFRIIKSLKTMDLIFVDKKNSSQGNQTNWYAINYPLLGDKLKNVLTVKKNLKKKEKNFIHQGYESENNIVERKYAPIKNEKPYCDFDKIYISNTDTNLHKTIFLYKNNENYKFEKSFEDNKNITKQKVERQKENFSKKEMEICNQMIQVWNKIFIKKSDKISFSERRGSKLLSLWYNLMEQNIEKWQDFCLRINSSKFLMGEKDDSNFKAYCDWLLQGDIAQKILIGSYGIGDRVPEVKREEKARQTLLIREKLIENQIAKNREYERQEQINKISNALQEQAVKELESEWNENEKQKVHEEFSTYLLDKFGWVFSEYKLKGIDSPLVSLHYDFYLIEKYFNNDPNIFVNKAKKLVDTTTYREN